MKAVLLALVVVFAITLPMHAGTPRVRPLTDRVADLVQEAASRSPTVARLLAEVEASDVILQIDLRFDASVPRAVTRLVTATADVRYVRTLINPQMSPWRRIELLAHELQHVIEIASDPSVRDQASMRTRFETLGWNDGRFGGFETDAAIAIEQQVRRELSAR
jgi:hypothetical protein